MLDADATDIVEIRKLKTSWGILRKVMARSASGEIVARSIRIPAEISVQAAQAVCRSAGGRFQPATPINPQRQLMSQLKDLPCKFQREILNSLIEDFEMPMDSKIELAKWKTASVNDLPDSAFILILPGGKKDETGRTVPRSLRLLPYKNARGIIDRSHVQNALARVNQVNAPANLKRRALSKLLRIARALGMKVQERERFKLADLDFYLEQLEKLEKMEDSNANS